jgi:hypothetical protein
MKTLLICFIYLLLSFSKLIAADDILISGTGSSLIDGVYEHNLDNSYQKKDASIKIVQSGNVWSIIDTKNNVYFAVTENVGFPPQKGWDVGRAGVGLNPIFKLDYDTNSVVIFLKNNTTEKQNIGVKFKNPDGSEQIRQFDIQADSTKKYSVSPETEITLFTNQETKLLMNKTKEIINGKALLKVRKQDNGRLINLF